MTPFDDSWWNKNGIPWKKRDVEKLYKEALRKVRIEKLKKIEKNK